MQVKQWAREHNVPPSTVYDALERGRITRTADGLDPVDAAAWLRSRKDRISEDQAADAGRQQVLDAMVAEAATDIQRLRRQLLELRQTTVATDDAARAARGRRWARLQAALASVPAVGIPQRLLQPSSGHRRPCTRRWRSSWNGSSGISAD